MTLAFNVLALRVRGNLRWLVLGNLTIAAGLLALRDVPQHPSELTAVRDGATSAVARSGEGWYGREKHGRHTWHWTANRGTVTIETWPKVESTLVLQFQLRALAPCTVVIRQDGREIARANANTALSSHVIDSLRIAGGHTTLEFLTDTPPSRASAAADARELAFALYDLRLRMKTRD